ncbi:MAG: hypothetical protein U9N50_07335, partial [Pseudomonadota bacterium]|nr:hypothetical protein [Pseudomonadota bacterium]
NSYLTPIISSFIVVNLRNSQLLRVIHASNLNILGRNLLRPELIRGSLKYSSAEPQKYPELSSSEVKTLYTLYSRNIFACLAIANTSFGVLFNSHLLP